MTPEQLAAVIGPPLGDVGAAFYFHPDTIARGKELGLDGFRFYGIGRGGVLGDVEALVVESAFGYFSKSAIDKLWTSARKVLDPRQAAREYLECCRKLGRNAFSDLAGLDEFNEAARAVNDAADPAGLALYAGYAAEPLADDTAGQAIQLAATLRELRGSVHLLAVRASGLSPLQAHAIKRPEEMALFGWHDEPPSVDSSHLEAYDAAEVLTNQILGPAFGAIDDSQAEALLAGATAMQDALKPPS